MNKRKWTIWLSAALLVALAVTGYYAIAAEYGSKEDPLVTVGYINDVLSPETLAEIQKVFDQQKAALDAQIEAKLQTSGAEIEAALAKYKSEIGDGTISDAVIEAIADQVIAKLEADGVNLGGSGSATETSWKVVTLAAGKRLIGEVGCEIILRIGSANCVAPASPGLINLTGGSELAGGSALAQNTLYIVTVKDRGISSPQGCTVVVNGNYTIS